MDANKRKPDHPQYDPTTIYIPDKEWVKFSPAMYQYWLFKKDNYDKVICFKIGKFYELFEEDAVICHKILDLHFM